MRRSGYSALHGVNPNLKKYENFIILRTQQKFSAK